MSEFVFRNLSIKLFPAEGEAGEDECPCCTYICMGDSQLACLDPSVPRRAMRARRACRNNCTLPPTGGGCGNECSFSPTEPECRTGCTYRDTIGECFDICTYIATFCEPCSTPGTYFIVPEDPGRRGAGDIRAELAVAKRRLRQRLAMVEQQEQQLEAAAKPRTIEEIERVRAQMVAAVSELDEQRARMEGGRPEPK